MGKNLFFLSLISTQSGSTVRGNSSFRKYFEDTVLAVPCGGNAAQKMTPRLPPERRGRRQAAAVWTQKRTAFERPKTEDKSTQNEKKTL